MRRRNVLRAAAVPVALTAGGVQAACGVPATHLSRLKDASADTPVLQPARQLALTLADLPDGFQLREELAPVFPATGREDPWGRLTAYSVTFAPVQLPAGAPPAGDVTSSINSYASADYARAAFAQWQAAVPRTYRRVDVNVGLTPQDSVAYECEGSCLIGLRTHNVLASVLVSRTPAGTGRAVSAPDTAARLARRMIERIEAGLH